MDGASALAFASAIMAVIDFSTKVLSKSHEIYKSGSTKEHIEFNNIAQEFKGVNEELELSIKKKQALTPVQGPNDKARITMETR